MFQQVEQKYLQTQQELQSVKSQIAQRNREIQLAEVTEKELKSEGVDTVWEGVGKIFMSTSLDDYLKSLENDKASIKDDITALNKKQHYLETTFKNVNDAITEMAKRGSSA
ncbi:hypothetical protein TRICI_001304 [Trichomonascus ciferrii]|uniref:Prefoldin subunit 1 n=1 Tax=Trichomonascus ciferrii TaxID=44093 RepID=A0A642V8U7_9ASCO|nr:hypothetical protein TRICI_001304 [Trichomonascus ciferrii]